MVTPPYGGATGDAKQRADVGIGPYAPRGDEGRHAGSSCPTGGCGEPPRLPWVTAHSGASAPAVARKWVGIAAEITPKVSSNAGQSLSHGYAVPAPFTQGSLGGRGMRIAVTSAPNFGIKFGWRWLRHRCVGPVGLLAMTMVFCHSEERSDVGIRPFCDGRGFGPPSRRPLRKVYRSPSNGPMWSSAPTERGGELPQLP